VGLSMWARQRGTADATGNFSARVICFLVDHRSQQVLEEIRDQARDAVSLSDEVMVGGE
jgi:hypothetical protein